SWSEFVLRIKNESSSAEVLEIECQIGSLEKKVHSIKVDVHVPGEMVIRNQYPIYIPEKLEEKKSTVSLKRNSFTPGRKGKQPLSRTLRNRTLPMVVLVKKNGVLLQRMTNSVMLLPSGTGFLHSENFKEEQVERLIPFVESDKKGWQLKKLAPEYGALSYKSISHYRDSNVPALETDLSGVRIIHLQGQGLKARETQSLLSWVARGGLLVVDPSSERSAAWYSLLEYSSQGELWGQLHLKKWKLLFEQPLLGQSHVWGEAWQLITDDHQLELGASRPWGAGSILALNFKRMEIFDDKPEPETKLILSVLPELALDTIKASQWPEWSRQELANENGFTSWSRSSVALFLVSFLIFALIVIYGPIASQKKEMKWLYIMGAILLWSCGAAFMLFLGGKSGTSMKTMSVRLLANDGAAGRDCLEVGAASLSGNEKRRFSLESPKEIKWLSLDHEKSRLLKVRGDFVSWLDCALFPKKEKSLSFYALNDQAPLYSEASLLFRKDELKMTLPKEWIGTECALVLGRSLWLFSAEENMNLKQSDGILLASDDLKSKLGLSLRALCQHKSESMPARKRCWLARISKADKNHLIVPDDISYEGQVLEILPIKPEYEKGELSMAYGVNHISFLRGKTQLKDSTISFDGVFFKESEVFAMPKGILFTIPCHEYGTFIPESITLSVKKVNELKTLSLAAQVQGKTRMLRANENGTFTIPIKAYEDGKVMIKILSSITENKAAIKHMAMNFKGRLK
ncbi:MAG: hypothetical protein HQL32_11670, partial [Planctomycetes bacterium]|nr:hypothetical protein [Planctomycetota bacterium]